MGIATQVPRKTIDDWTKDFGEIPLDGNSPFPLMQIAERFAHYHSSGNLPSSAKVLALLAAGGAGG